MGKQVKSSKTALERQIKMHESHIRRMKEYIEQRKSSVFIECAKLEAKIKERQEVLAKLKS